MLDGSYYVIGFELENKIKKRGALVFNDILRYPRIE